IYLTPTLDSEFVTCGEVRSLESIAQTPKGVPTPAILTRATHLLKPFSNIEILNLGIKNLPRIEHFTKHEFGISVAGDITNGANIDAMDVFKKGLDFGQEYECKDDYIILAESVPAGTTTAAATAVALGYDCKEMFSSSFK
ncbi:nicotinate-nucleotide--dimethylbenzimidazole phosphoribosyltransferase, partial [Arcobacter sp. CECT 8989]